MEKPQIRTTCSQPFLYVHVLASSIFLLFFVFVFQSASSDQLFLTFTTRLFNCLPYFFTLTKVVFGFQSVTTLSSAVTTTICLFIHVHDELEFDLSLWLKESNETMGDRSEGQAALMLTSSISSLLYFLCLYLLSSPLASNVFASNTHFHTRSFWDPFGLQVDQIMLNQPILTEQHTNTLNSPKMKSASRNNYEFLTFKMISFPQPNSIMPL